MAEFVVEVLGDLRVRARFSVEAASEDEARLAALTQAKKCATWKRASIAWTHPPDRMRVKAATQAPAKPKG